MTRLAALAGLGLAAACSDGTGPNQTSFDAAKVEAGLAVVEQATTAPVIKSFGALGASISGSQAVSATGPDRFVSAVRKLAGIVRPDVNAALVPVIGGDVLGQTYVYNQASGIYVVDPARTGAPANGVRFILYQPDANDHPTSTEVGCTGSDRRPVEQFVERGPDAAGGLRPTSPISSTRSHRAARWPMPRWPSTGSSRTAPSRSTSTSPRMASSSGRAARLRSTRTSRCRARTSR
ncbi:MAG: hypothetical protein R2882_13660 [Gemmatimonadales bacterium]